MTRVSLTECYDDRSVISKLKRIEDKVDRSTVSAEASAQAARRSADAAQHTADTFSGAVGSVVGEAQREIAQARADVTEAKTEVDAVVEDVASAVRTANQASASAQAGAQTVQTYDDRLRRAEVDIQTLDGETADLYAKDAVNLKSNDPTQTAQGLRIGTHDLRHAVTTDEEQVITATKTFTGLVTMNGKTRINTTFFCTSGDNIGKWYRVATVSRVEKDHNGDLSGTFFIKFLRGTASANLNASMGILNVSARTGRYVCEWLVAGSNIKLSNFATVDHTTPDSSGKYLYELWIKTEGDFNNWYVQQINGTTLNNDVLWTLSPINTRRADGVASLPTENVYVRYSSMMPNRYVTTSEVGSDSRIVVNKAYVEATDAATNNLVHRTANEIIPAFKYSILPVITTTNSTTNQTRALIYLGKRTETSDRMLNFLYGHRTGCGTAHVNVSMVGMTATMVATVTGNVDFDLGLVDADGDVWLTARRKGAAGSIININLINGMSGSSSKYPTPTDTTPDITAYLDTYVKIGEI